MLLARNWFFGRSAFPLLGKQDRGGGCETCEAGAKGEGKASPLHVTMIEVVEGSMNEAPKNDAKPKQEEPMLWCPRCNARLTELKCKLLCERCGYYMSCADYY